MKRTVLTWITLAGPLLLMAQNNELVGQYFQNMPAYAPALTGMHDNLDITLGARKQWIGFTGSPENSFIGAYGVLHSRDELPKAMAPRTEEAAGNTEGPPSTMKIKHGLGGYLINHTQGAYAQTEGAIVYAVHIPVFSNNYVSLGVSPACRMQK